MKFLHHLAILILPIVVLLRPTIAKVEPRVTHLAVRDPNGPVSGGHTPELRNDPCRRGWEKEPPTNNIPDSRSLNEVQDAINEWFMECKALRQDGSSASRDKAVKLIWSINEQLGTGADLCGSSHATASQKVEIGREMTELRKARKTSLRIQSPPGGGRWGSGHYNLESD